MAISLVKNMRLVLGFTTAVLLTSMTGHALAMSPFQASYQFSYNGKNLGSATRTLSKSGNQWNYVFSARAGGLASATESSRFSFNEGKIISNDFKRSSKVLLRNDTLTIDFRPEEHLITTKKNNKARSFAWKSGVLDELNAELQIREDLKASGLKSTYPIADAKAADIRHFTQEGHESIKTRYGTFNTIKVKIQHSDPQRNTIFWLAPELDYLPVKVSHKDEGSSYGLLLTGYKGPTQ